MCLCARQVTEAHVEALYTLARCKFDCGLYADAADFLFYFRTLSRDDEKRFLAAWGKLAAEVLLNSEAALQDLSELRDALEARVRCVWPVHTEAHPCGLVV